MNYLTAFSYIISHIFLILFFYLFMIHRYSQVATILIYFLLFSVLCILDFSKLILFPDSALCYVVSTILQIIATQTSAFFTARRQNYQTLFIGLSASSYVIAGAVSSAIIKIYTGNSIWAIIGSIAVHFVILVFLSFTIRKPCLRFQEKGYEKGWWKMCLIPIFFYCSVSFIAFFPHTLYDNPDNIIGTVFIIITMFASYIIVLSYIESEAKRIAGYWENKLQESYIRGLENRHYLVAQAEQNLKILHHDIRHYSNIIDSLLEQKRYEEIKGINEQISHMADENKVKEYCSNLIVNTILSNMMNKALSLDIKVDLNAKIPKEIPVNDYELAIVIANLFENAIQCVKPFEKGKRYIEIEINCMNNQLFIQTKNEYEGEIILDSTTKLPKSKKNGNHGWGMQSILSFSKKISGTVGCYLDNGIFHIMLYAKF